MAGTGAAAALAAAVSTNPFEMLDLPAVPSFAGILEHLYQQRYNGSVTFHFENGTPRGVVLTQARQVSLARSPK